MCVYTHIYIYIYIFTYTYIYIYICAEERITMLIKNKNTI